MSVIITVLMQDDRRGESPRKHVRLPAIAPKDDQSSSSSTRSGRLNGPTIPPRARLPPRSRTGCWTCRQRKVKCDEGRPVCGQCGRLGHACDYSPRLSFRDDTLRVVERMQDVTTTGSTVWDTVTSPTPSSAGSAIADDLPPFSTLVTDEDRERKAESSTPGTYNVVVNPNSFQHLPEYSDDVEIKRERLLPLRRASIAASLASSIGRDSVMEGIAVPGDPNTVILPRFEDLSRRPPRELKTPVLPVTRQKQYDDGLGIRIKVEAEEGNDLLLVEHFRSVVWKQLVPTEDLLNSSFDLIEKIAKDFPPLFHTMLAVASQSSSMGEHKESYDALQHYTHAIEFLKKEEDLASDGVFLTHFLMLIYEIATADIEHSLIRNHHMSMLIRITNLRRQTLLREHFPFVIWWICNIDLDALFCGIGAGLFLLNMLENETVPPPSFHLYPLGADGSSIVFGEERDSLPMILQLDYDVTLLACQLALLAQEFRQDSAFRVSGSRQRDMTVRLRQSRMHEIQESLRQRWMAPNALALGQHALPTRARSVWEHAYALYRACLIFSHTSMWHAQRIDTAGDFDEEIAMATTEVLQLAQGIIYSGRLESRFLVFPIFIAGYASADGQQKMTALDLLSRMEVQSIGRNTSTARRAMEAVFDKQNEQFMINGHSLDVDWMTIMSDEGLSVINFGM